MTAAHDTHPRPMDSVSVQRPSKKAKSRSAACSSGKHMCAQLWRSRLLQNTPYAHTRRTTDIDRTAHTHAWHASTYIHACVCTRPRAWQCGGNLRGSLVAMWWQCGGNVVALWWHCVGQQGGVRVPGQRSRDAPTQPSCGSGESVCAQGCRSGDSALSPAPPAPHRPRERDRDRDRDGGSAARLCRNASPTPSRLPRQRLHRSVAQWLRRDASQRARR